MKKLTEKQNGLKFFQKLDSFVEKHFLVFELDENLFVINQNDLTAQTIGMTIEKNFKDLLKDRTQFEEVSLNLFSTGTWEGELELKGENNSTWMELSIVQQCLKENDYKFLVLGKNISKVKRKDEMNDSIAIISQKSIEYKHDLHGFVKYCSEKLNYISQASFSMFGIFNENISSKLDDYFTWPNLEIKKSLNLIDAIVENVSNITGNVVKTKVEINNIEYHLYGYIKEESNGKKIFLISVFENALPVYIEQGELDFYYKYIDQKIKNLISLQDQKQREQKNQLIIEKTGIGIWEFDIVNNTLAWDKTMYDLYEIQKSDFSGDYEAWQNSLHPEDFESASLAVENCLFHNKEFDTEFRVITKDKRIKWIRAKAFVKRDIEGKPLVMTGVNMDITKEVMSREEVEEQRKISMNNARLASIGEMAAGIGHEINNPLTIIESSLMVLRKLSRKGKLDIQTMEKYYDQIEGTTKKISTIVNGLRNLTRKVDKDEFLVNNLGDILKETTEMYAQKCKAKGIHFLFDAEDFNQLNLMCERVQISQVFVNLLNNAYFAAQDSIGDMWIKIELVNSNHKLEIEISDSGRGVSEDKRTKIFDPFFTTKKVGDGTGLGLSLSKKIMIKHNGDLNLKHGTRNTFVMKFPTNLIYPIELDQKVRMR